MSPDPQDSDSEAKGSFLHQLPTEIFEIITTRLALKELLKLRLTSRWCERGVFKSFACRVFTHLELSCDTKTVSRLGRVLTEGSLGPFVKTLVINQPSSKSDNTNAYNDGPNLQAALEGMFRTMPNLKELYLHGRPYSDEHIRHGYPFPSLREAILRSGHTAASLTFESCTLDSASWGLFLQSLGQLERLDLRMPRSADNGWPSILRTVIGMNLEELYVSLMMNCKHEPGADSEDDQDDRAKIVSIHGEYGWIDRMLRGTGDQHFSLAEREAWFTGDVAVKEGLALVVEYIEREDMRRAGLRDNA